MNIIDRMIVAKDFFRLNKQLKTAKIVHLMEIDKFNKPFVEFINRNFNSDEHLFLCRVLRVKHPKPKAKNVIMVRKFSRLNLEYENIQKIIFHSFFRHDFIDLLYKNQKLLEKSYWMIWGGDLYNSPNDEKNLFVRKHIANLISDVDGDCQIAKNKFNNLVAKSYNACYTFPINLEMIENIRIDKKSDIVKIQINNSCDRNILEMLTTLTHFKDENILIQVILSYGDLQYKQDIIKLGKMLYGDKFSYIEDYLSPLEYAKVLSKNDILILNQDRQQGLGNTLASLSLGVKVYIKSNITTYEHFLSKGIVVFDTYKINKDLEFKDFIEYKTSFKNNNILKTKELLTDSYMKQLWEPVFKYKDEDKQ